jgi:hypothetical protein
MELAHLMVKRQDSLNQRLDAVERLAGLDTKKLQQHDQELKDGINHLVGQLKGSKVEDEKNG